MRQKSKDRFSLCLEGVPRDLFRTKTAEGALSKVHQLSLEDNPHMFIRVFRAHCDPVRVKYRDFERIVKNVHRKW